jgi:hypothetical protein
VSTAHPQVIGMADSSASDPDANAPADDAALETTIDDAATEPAADAPTDVVTGATGPQLCGFTPCAPGQPCPDLVVDVDDLRSSILIDERTFGATDCAVVEGCISAPGARRLLHFDTATANIGTADLVIGSPMSNACFQFSQCHQHFHFRGVGTYTLYKTDGVTVAARGHKQGFCMEDTEPYGAQPGPDPAIPFNCDAQGLHVGWEDVYPNDIDCQWVDITGVPAGDYVLSVTVDAERLLPEVSYDNNEARVPVTIPEAK